jgi:hypothetical protein
MTTHNSSISSRTAHRFVVHDEDGPLRAFRTKAAARGWLQPGMSLVVKPKPPSRYELAVRKVGEALI